VGSDGNFFLAELGFHLAALHLPGRRSTVRAMGPAILLSFLGDISRFYLGQPGLWSSYLHLHGWDDRHVLAYPTYWSR
jgi:hypothetical protein